MYYGEVGTGSILLMHWLTSIVVYNGSSAKPSLELNLCPKEGLRTAAHRPTYRPY